MNNQLNTSLIGLIAFISFWLFVGCGARQEVLDLLPDNTPVMIRLDSLGGAAAWRASFPEVGGELEAERKLLREVLSGQVDQAMAWLRPVGRQLRWVWVMEVADPRLLEEQLLGGHLSKSYDFSGQRVWELVMGKGEGRWFMARRSGFLIFSREALPVEDVLYAGGQPLVGDAERIRGRLGEGVGQLLRLGPLRDQWGSLLRKQGRQLAAEALPTHGLLSLGPAESVKGQVLKGKYYPEEGREKPGRQTATWAEVLPGDLALALASGDRRMDVWWADGRKLQIYHFADSAQYAAFCADYPLSDTYRMFDLRRKQGAGAPNCLLPFYPYAFAADEAAALHRWADRQLTGQMLLQEESLLPLLSQRPDSGRLGLLLRPARSRKLLQQWLPNPAVLGEKPLALFTRPGEEATDWFLYRGEAPAAPEGPDLFWQASLAEAGGKVLEICPGPADLLLVQERGGLLKAYDARGELRWTRKLPGEVLSRVYRLPQGDYLFHTRESVWRLNAEGAPFAPFPLQLPRSAVGDLALLNWNGRGPSHFFIHTLSGKIYGYELQGSPLPGWHPLEAGAEPLHPLLHLRRPEKDFLFLTTTAGKLLAWNKAGEAHFPPLLVDSSLVHPPLLQSHPDFPRLIFPLPDGRARIVAPDGSHFPLSFAEAVDSLCASHWWAVQLWGDDRLELAILCGARLSVFGYNSRNELKRLWSYTFPEAQEELFLRQTSAGAPLLGTRSEKNNRLYLLSARGRLLPGFPLAGSCAPGLLPLAGSSSMLLVSMLNDQLVAYRLPEVENEPPFGK